MFARFFFLPTVIGRTKDRKRKEKDYFVSRWNQGPWNFQCSFRGLDKFLQGCETRLFARVCSTKLRITFTKKRKTIAGKLRNSPRNFRHLTSTFDPSGTEEHAIPLRKVGPETAGLNFYGISPRFHNSVRRFNFLVAGTSLREKKKKKRKINLAHVRRIFFDENIFNVASVVKR